MILDLLDLKQGLSLPKTDVAKGCISKPQEKDANEGSNEPDISLIISGRINLPNLTHPNYG